MKKLIEFSLTYVLFGNGFNKIRVELNVQEERGKCRESTEEGKKIQTAINGLFYFIFYITG